ncbi:peptidylprolyl isomerase [Tabrizicola sp. L79]|uniref:peptidylprolyl isomerase n=1 Tax=Pseudotabrizicola sp. L79 TaxID=3118402 RepID=UPI002F93AE6E
MAPAMAQDAGTVVATVDGTEITLGHMIALREQLPAQYQSLPDDVLYKGILDQLVQQTALAQSVGEPSLKDRLALENDRRGYLSGVALQTVVASSVTDEALQAAYEAKFADMAPQKEYNAAHILVDSEEKANELKTQLDGGADFAELAKANSTDTGSGANGGDLGWFGLGMMVKPFEEAVVAAEPGKVVGPVQSQFGYHLIMVKETRVAEAPSLDEMRDELASEIEQAAVQAHITALTEKADVTRPGDSFDPALLRDATLLDK